MQLRSATIDAMNAWNRTGAFTFKQIDNKRMPKLLLTSLMIAGQTLQAKLQLLIILQQAIC